MNREKILFRISCIAIGLMAFMPSPALAHCYAGQVCVPDPCNTHHGGTCPPKVQQSIDAMHTMQEQASSGAVKEVFTVVEIESLDVPVDSSGQSKTVPDVEMPKPEMSKSASTPESRSLPQDSPAKKQSSAPPMTPAEFARQGLPVRNEQELNILKQGVLDSSRELLDVAASAANDNMVSKYKKADAVSGRMSVQHLNFSSEALNKLRQYSKIMEETRGMIGQEKIYLSEEKWSEIEKLNRYTQSVIQQEGAPDK